MVLSLSFPNNSIMVFEFNLSKTDLFGIQKNLIHKQEGILGNYQNIFCRKIKLFRKQKDIFESAMRRKFPSVISM